MKLGRMGRPQGRVYAAGLLGLGLACGLVALAHRGGRNLRGGQSGKVSAPTPVAAVLASPHGQAAGGVKSIAAAVPGRGQALNPLGAATRDRLRASYARLPLSFEPNQGQTDKAVKFLARGPGYNLFLTADQAVLTLRAAGEIRNPKSEIRKSKGAARNSQPAALISSPEPPASAVLRLKLRGSNPAAEVAGVDGLSGKSNYFLGNDPKGWQTDVPTFARVKYHGVYPGVDLVYYGQQNQLEYDFVVAPGADPKAITLEIETRNSELDNRSMGAAAPLAIDARGDLVVNTAAGEVRFHKPCIYQPTRAKPQTSVAGRPLAATTGSVRAAADAEKREPVDGRYVLLAGNRVRFEVANYDQTRPLIIDPVLSYATYLGGTNDDVGVGIAVNSSGNAYVAGTTGSLDFPTSSPYQAASGGSLDVFAAELKPDGSGLVYSTYLGGHGSDRAAALSLNSAGNVYLTGSTNSDNFPTTAGVLKTAFGGGSADAFVVELNPSGSGLVFSTYLGGGDADYGQAIAVDASGNAFITGHTRSDDFPTTHPLQATFGGGLCDLSPCVDAFVTALNPSGGSLVYSTYLGGEGADYGQAIALDGSGNAYVAGSTASDNFVVTTGVAQPTYGGTGPSGDAFIAKISPLDEPSLSLRPGKLTFADQATGTSSAAETVTLINSGSAALDISDIAISGDFTQTNTCGGALDPGGAQCNVQVSFAPTTTGDLTGTLTITDNAAGSPHQVTLDGKGTTPAPAVTLSPTSLDFGNVPYTTTSAPQTVTVTNSGTADLTISSVAITGDFAQTNDCPTTAIAPGAFCTVTVTFTPTTATGTASGTVTITDDATGSPQTVSVTGVGVPDYALTISPTSAIVERGATSTTFTVGVTAPEAFTSSITLSCTTTYTTASCAFNPTSITPTQTSTLTLSGLAGETGASLDVAVAGTSGVETANVNATITFSDFWLYASPPLQNIASGDTTTYTVTVSSINGFAEAVALTCIAAASDGTAARDSTCTFAPASVTLDGVSPSTATVTVTTKPFSAVAPHTGRRVSPPPLGGSYWVWFGGMAALLLVSHRWLRRQRRVWARLAAPIAALILFVMLLSSCQDYNYDLGIRPELDRSTGTKRDNYTLVFTGTYGEVARYAGVLMSVR